MSLLDRSFGRIGDTRSLTVPTLPGTTPNFLGAAGTSGSADDPSDSELTRPEAIRRRVDLGEG
jgi:hypothetical protein